MTEPRKADHSMISSVPQAGWRVLLRPRVLALLTAVVLVVGLSFVKSAWLNHYSRQKLEFAENNNEKISNLFQSSFFFLYDEQFRPGIEFFLKGNPEITRLLVVSSSGQVVFDSESLPGKTTPYVADAQLNARSAAPTLMSDPQGVGVLITQGQYSIYYVFSTRTVMIKVLVAFVLGLLLIGGSWLGWPSLRPRASRLSRLVPRVKLYSLRTKLVATFILVNVITGLIIFFSQSYSQKAWLTGRTVQAARFAAESMKDQVIANFSNYYFFYYKDRFVPAIRQMMAARENLMALRIVSRKSGQVVFDSDEMDSIRQPSVGNDARRAAISDEIQAELRNKPSFLEVVTSKGGEPYIRVITTYFNENQETPFLIEYLFSFSQLKERLRTLRSQIIVQLLPSFALGIVVAIFFAQLIVGPIKRLVRAANAIAGGNYEVDVETNKRDELGDLLRAFGAMVEELKRKTELRKYLSDHTYQRVVNASEGGDVLGGARVRATVLFSDIRNFVSVCEALEAEEVTAMLNEYFSAMVEVIYKHKGEVDKFIGDAVLAVFYDQNDLRQPGNTALNAIYCAMEMRERLAEFNAKRVARGNAPIEIGIGINSGEIISGPIGSPDRRDFTVIGDVVNLANRIEKVSKQGRHTRIVFSNHVEEKVRGLLEYEELSKEKIRGKEENVVVYELVRIKDVESLLGNLSNPDPAVKIHCIELLGYSRNPAVLPRLYEKLSDSDAGVRIAAIVSMGRLAPTEHGATLDVLFKQLDQERSERVLSTALMAVGKLTNGRRLLELTKFLDRPEDRIVANAIEAIGAASDADVIDLIIPFLASKNNRVKANAAMVLFRRGRVEVIDALKPMLLHSDHLMRASAAFALGELTSMAGAKEVADEIRENNRLMKHFLGELQGSVPMLVSLLKDPEPLVKRQAIIALGKIKDKTAVLPLLDNLDPSRDSKEMVREVAEALRGIGSHKLVREVVQQLS